MGWTEPDSPASWRASPSSGAERGGPGTPLTRTSAAGPGWSWMKPGPPAEGTGPKGIKTSFIKQTLLRLNLHLTRADGGSKRFWVTKRFLCPSLTNKPSPSAHGASQSRPPCCWVAVGGPSPLRTPPGLRRGTAPSWGRVTRSQSPPRCVRVSPPASSLFVWMFPPETPALGEVGGRWQLVRPQTSSPC